MNKTYKLSTIQALLQRSWQELQSRFLPLFLLALLGPIVSWVLRGIIVGFDPLQSEEVTVNLLLAVPCALLGLVLSAWCLIAFVLFVCKRASDWKELFALALLRIPRFIAGLFIYGIAITVYTALCILLSFLFIWLLHNIPALNILVLFIMVAAFTVGLVAASVYLILLPYVLILTNVPLLDTFATAYRFIKNRWWYTFVLLIVLSLIGMFVGLICFLVLGIAGIASYIIWPASRYLLAFLSVIPAALMILIQQIPLIALYIDSSHLPEKAPQDTAPTNL